MSAKALPLFVRCITNSENKVCEVGRVYSTLEPVTQVKANAFWKKTLNMFHSEFEVATVDAYVAQKDDHADSFNHIQHEPQESVFLNPADKKRPKKKKKHAPSTHTANPPQPNIPAYVKYIKHSTYAYFWLGLKKEDIGKTFRTDVEFDIKIEGGSQKWRTALSIHSDCFEVSDKLHWNLSREHSVEIKKETNGVKEKFVFSWEKYPLKPWQKVWEYELEHPETWEHRRLKES